MKIILKKEFAGSGPNIHISNDGNVTILDPKGNELVQGMDYEVSEREKLTKIELQLASGAWVYFTYDR